MTAEGRTIRLSSLFFWMPFGLPLVTLAIFVVLVLVPREPPGFAYLLSDSIALPIIALSMAGVILMTGLFTGHPFTPRPPPGQPPPSARWGLRIALAAIVALSFFALRFPIIQGATPTHKAVEAMRRHAVAGKAIGAPVEIGWRVQGWIHSSGTVNDVPVPARIDASVPVQGPRGSGTLSIEGHEEGSRWVFDRLWLRLDRGGERIDIAGAPAPRARSNGDDVDPTTIAVIGGSVLFTVLLVSGLLWMLRSSDPSRAVASIEVTAGAPVALDFMVREARPHHVWLRFEIDYEGGEDDYGVTAELRIDVTGGPSYAVEQRVGDRAPALGPKGTTNSGLYRVTQMSGPGGDSIRATTAILTLPAAPVGAKVHVSGRVVVAEGQKAVGLLLFVVPK